MIMNYSILKKLGYFFMSFTLVISGNASAAIIADDTEIYFSAGTDTSGTVDQTIIPNILFILDTSGSMTASVPQAGGDQRIKVLKDAMKSIINDVEDVNIGLMRFTSGSGGPVLFPISFIDGNVGNVVSEVGSANELTYEATVSSGLNDGEENNDGAGDAGEMTLGDTILETIAIETVTNIGSTVDISQRIDGGNRDAEEDIDDGSMSRGGSQLDHRTSGSTELVGLVFRNINIPDNSLINSAFIDYTCRRTGSSSTNMTIHGFDEDNPSDFSNTAFDISSRTKTTASEVWTGVAPCTSTNQVITSVDIKDIVQEIVSRGCSNPASATPDPTDCTYANDRMGFIVTTTAGNRKIRSRNSSSSRAPRLRVQYQTTTAVSGAGDKQIIGFRFENIKIPKDATVTSASLVFTPQVDDTGTTVWDIDAEDSGDSAEFDIADTNFSSRTMTGTPAKWSVPAWTTDVQVETTDNSTRDLKQVVADVVSHADWCGGNSMSFFITDATNSATVFREIQSFENNSSNAVKFKYGYTSGTGNCYAATETGQSSILADDAEQNGTTVTINGTDLSLGTDTVGIRFQGIEVPPDASITDARLKFYAKSTDTSTASFTIKGELPSDGDANVFTASDNDISSRTFSSTTVTWVPDEWNTVGSLYTSDDIKSIVTDMVKSSNSWASGNDMAFVIVPRSGTRTAESWDSNPAFAPRLSISFEDTADSSFKTVRERLI
ncbi:MAG: VWA domain-containing protein, partial [Proteobacteria bacterium]|nr:VWA domain-containing protein [Pseudomonadota bacterium]